MALRIESIDDDDVRRKYYEEGWTQKEIAEYYGVNHVTIYYRIHPEKMKEAYNKRKGTKAYKESQRKYDKTDKRKESIRRYNQSEKQRKNKDRYFSTKKGRDCIGRYASKRRQLGFTPLNSFFDGGQWHHYDTKHVICIPEELHKMYTHNVWTGKNMELINKEAFEFLDYELREEAWDDTTGDWMVGEY